MHPPTATGQEMATYYETTDLLSAPPASFREGLLGYANPALPALTDNQFVGAWSTDGRAAASVRDWGVFSSVGGLGSALVRRNRGPLRVTGYHVSLAGGGESGAIGVGYQGFGGDATALGRYNRLTAGTVLRPSPYLSLGLVGNVSLENDEREVVGEIGVRPFGTSRLTLFADAAWGEGEALADVPWSAGAAVELVQGVDLTGRLFETEAVTAGLRVEFGRLGIGSQARVNPQSEYAGQVNRVRLGTDVPSAIGDAAMKGESRVEVRPKSVPYRGPRLALASDAGPRYYEVLRTLRRARTNDRVSVVALDLSGLSASREQAWELRRAVEAAQDTGTTVVAFVENGGMNVYHLASAADHVVMDARGTLTLPGYATSRTFLKGTLDELGLGIQVFRYFEYKSAFETLSRINFSAADSLQRQQLVNDWYRLARTDIAEGRGLAPDTVDHILNQKVLLDAHDAQQAGLVDTLGRWHERNALLSSLTGTDTRTLGADRLNDLETASRRWGARPQVAIVYGIGPTSTGSGIRAKELARTFRDLAENDDVAAVVFRVDSPGGSALAADIAAQAVRECAGEKPVIVSQGTVAASGGYLISTYADRILAGPNTVTGSIGVIGLWAYDDGLLRDKAEFGYDVVQRGAKADLFAPYRVPFLGAPLVPSRKLSADELDRVRHLILRSYDDFVAQVATGRDTTESHVRSVAEGRVYSGREGQDRGLVDEIGGLSRAVVVAQRAAGLEDETVRIREVNPYTGFLDLPGPLPFGLGGVLGIEPKRPAANTPGLRFVRTVLETQPQPLMVLPPGYYAAPSDGS